MMILPTLISAFIIFISVSGNKYTVGIIDYDQTQFTKDFREYLGQTCKIVDIEEEELIAGKIMNDGIESVFVIEKGDTDTLLQTEKIEIKSYYQEGSNYAEPIQMKVASYLSAARLIASVSKQNSETFYKGMKDFCESEMKADYQYSGEKVSDKTDAALTALGYMAFCMLFLMTFSTSLIMEDKTSGVLARLRMSPLSTVQYYLQHILGYFLISFIQTAIVVQALPYFSPISFGHTYIDKVRVIIVALIFSLACIAMGVAINNFAKNKLAAGSISSLINLPMLMLGGCFWPNENMPEVLQNIGMVLPTTWFLKAGKEVLYGASLLDVWRYIVLLLSFTIVVITLTFLIKSNKE